MSWPREQRHPHRLGEWGQFEAEGGRLTEKDDKPVCLRVAATPGYLEAMGMKLIEGRPF